MARILRRSLMTSVLRVIAVGGLYWLILSLLIGFLSILKLKVSNAKYIIYIALVMLLLTLLEGAKI